MACGRAAYPRRMPISALPVPVRRVGYRVAHAGLRVYWRVARPQTRGVKCVVREATRWSSSATPTATGASGSCRAAGSSAGRTRATRRRGRRARSSAWTSRTGARWGPSSPRIRQADDGHVLRGDAPGRALTVDAGEIEEAGWFALADPPVPLGLDARVVLTRLLVRRRARGRPRPAARSPRASPGGRARRSGG